MINRFGWTVLTALTVLLITATQPWLPPVGIAVNALSGTSARITPLAVDAGLGLALAALARGVLSVVGRRR